MKKKQRYSAEVKERAVRLVQDSLADHKSQWSAICSIATKVGCSPETLRNWVRQSNGVEVKSQSVEADAERIKLLEREVFELRRANEILRKASAFCAQAELALQGHSVADGGRNQHRPLKNGEVR